MGMINLMDSKETWLGELAALSAASPQIAELAPLGVKKGLDLTFGRVTDGSAATCWIAGSDRMFSDLVDGRLTLQRAHVTGQARLSGNPEGLLRLAFLFDAAHESRKRQSGAGQASEGCGVPSGAS